MTESSENEVVRQHEFKKRKKDKFHIPIFVPAEPGREPKTVIAEGALLNGKLTITFNDRLPAQAIQRMIEREFLIGLSFVLLRPAGEGEEGVRLDGETGTNSPSDG